jgi:hypothetical protein
MHGACVERLNETGGDVAAHGAFVFWTEERQIRRHDVATGTSEVFADMDTPGVPGRLTIEGPYLYWTHASDIYRTPWAGGIIEPLEQSPQIDPRDIAVDSQNLYWLTSNGEVWKQPLAGGPPAQVSLPGPAHLLEGTAGAAYVAYTLTNVSHPIVRLSPDGSAPAGLLTSTSRLTALTVDSGVLYFGANDRVYRAPATGGLATILALNVFGIRDLFADSGHVYIASDTLHAGRLSKVPVGGGNVTGLGAFADVNAVAVDSTTVYAAIDGGVSRITPK